MPLVPCEECRRHVRAAESSCPFCKTTRTPVLVAALAGSALLLAGCASASKYGGPPAQPDLATPDASVEVTPASPRLADPTPEKKPDEPVIAPVSKYGGPPRP